MLTKWLAVALLGAAVLGLVALHPELAGFWVLAIWVPVLAVLLLRVGSRWPALVIVLGVAIGALVVPVFALLGVDWVWARVWQGRLDPVLSLVAGAAIVGAAAWVYLRPWWVRQPAKHAFWWALFVVLVLVVAPPFVWGLIGVIKGDQDHLSRPPVAISQLDVVVLRDQSEPIDPDRIQDRDGWRIETWEGHVAGERVRWGGVEPPPFLPREDADRVLLLMVGEDAQSDEVQRWLRVADAVTHRSTPTFALLEGADQANLEVWRAELNGHGGPHARRRGDARLLEDFAGTPTTTDLALRLGIRARTSDQDLALAAQHRPALFFDSGERKLRPLDVDDLLASGAMRLCDQGQELRTACPSVHGSGELHNGASHLAFEPEEVSAVKGDSTIYVHVSRSGNDHPNTIYLDYWWYFPHNPTGAAGGALCGAGFVVAGVTCFDHQSDWEGVTVVLDGDSPSGPPTAVHYAQHGGVVRYEWSALQELWNRPRRNAEDSRSDRERFGMGVDTRRRPLVFVARGTHASYPRSCSSGKCTDSVPGIHSDRAFKENRHDGGTAWPGAATERCESLCLTAVPTRAGGREPARWNAFHGRWGNSHCVLGVVCADSQPPRSPNFQDRYRHPWCYDEAYSWDGRRFTDGEASCPGRTASEDELATGERLIALGDSFSSGQGAGTYDPGTTGRGNTCYRSRLAWPERVAETLDLTALRSLACSGAVIAHVTENGHGKEHERQRSQVSRIHGDPDVVTLSIGGNDAGFADVLTDCVLGDCVRRYKKKSGDLLEEGIAKLATRLPAVYRAVQRAAPDARVVVMGYPRIFPEELGADVTGNCAAWKRISAKEVTYLNSASRSLNATIDGAAGLAGVDFVDVTEAFDGRELRCSGETYMNPLRLRTRLFPASFHPNETGHARLAEVFAAQIDSP